jgi:UDP-glucose 6-dehydrogenase
MLSRTPYEAIPNTEAAHAVVTVDATARKLTSLNGSGATVHANTSSLIIQAEGAAVRFTTTLATAPTTAIGHQLAVGDVVQLSRAEFEAARFIRATGTDATLQVGQYR